MDYSPQTKKKIKLLLKPLQPFRYLEFIIVLPITLFYLFFWKRYLLSLGYLNEVVSQKRVLYILPDSIKALKGKGNFHLALEKDLDGFFDFTMVNYRSSGKRQMYQPRKDYIINDSPSKIYLFPGIYTLLLFHYFCRQIYKNDINIIHVTSPFYLGMVGLVCSWVFKIPITLSIHAPYDQYVEKRGKGDIAHLNLPLIEYLFQWIVFKNVDTVMAIDPYYKEYIKKKVGFNRQINFIPHGIDIDWWGQVTDNDVKENLGLEGGKMIVLVCRIAEDKEIRLVPAIARIVLEEHPDAAFVWAGGGDYEDKIKNFLLDLGISDKFYFLGFQDKEKVKSLRYAADINLCIWDGFSQLEAMISGRPVVCGYNYFNSIKNKVNGICVDDWQKDYKSYAWAINFLLDNPKKGDELGKSARDEVITNYSLKYTNEIKKKLYLKIFDKNYEKK